MSTTVKVQIQQRIDTASAWTTANPTLLSGEIGWESDTKKYKIGDGSTAWASLTYAPGSGGYTAGTGVAISASNVISASAIALSQVSTAANQAAHLALTTQEGDIVVRSDENKSYVRNSGTASDMTDYTLLATPTDAVLSVNGNTGAITADQLAAAIESASDSNTFTDADHTKLNSLSTTLEGTAITSTGESGGTKFLREDGDGTCSWQSATVDVSGKADLSGATFTGDVTFTGDSSNGLWDKSANEFVANLNGNVTGDVTGNVSGTAATVTGAAQANITSLGTLTAITIDGSYKQVSEAVGALDIDLSTGNYFTKTINANSTFTFSNPAASGTVSAFTLELTHTSGTITWPTTVVWNGGVGKTAPTVATGKTHLFMFVTDDAGTTYRGAVLADYDNAA